MSETINISFEKLTRAGLGDGDRNLIDLAIAAMDGAHAPYSNFQVGSAVLIENGDVVTGNNQENAAYPSGLCAERVALFAAKSQSKQSVKAISVVAKNQHGHLADAFSCGNCRQVMLEYAAIQKEPIRIIMRSANDTFIVLSDVRELLPFSFDSKTLG